MSELYFKKRTSSPTVGHRRKLARLVGKFLAEMHRHDAGRTLPLLHAARLSTPQLAVLEFVRSPRTVSTIAEHVHLSRPATSQLINKLVHRHLVRRSEGTADRRQKTVLLNRSGAVWLEKVESARIARFEDSLALLAPRTSIRLAHAIANAIREMNKVEAADRKHRVSPGD